jgi:hypothetical protein
MRHKKTQQGHIGAVTLRRTYHVDREGDTFRIWSSTERGADFGQTVEGKVIRYLAKALQGQTVTVPEAKSTLLKSGIRLPYKDGYKLHFFAQSVLIALVASRQASHRKVGNRFEYDLA